MGAISNKRVAQNTVILYFRMMLTLGVALYVSKVALEVLGASDYGVYNVVGGVVSMLAFINASMGAGTSRFMAFELGRGDNEKLSKVFNVSLVSHVVIASIIFLISETVGLWFVNSQLVFPPERSFAVNVVYQISILTAMLQFTQLPFNADIIAHEEMGIYAYLSIADVFLKLLMVLFLKYVETPDGLIAYSILLFIIQTIILLSYRFYCLKHYPESRWNFVKDKTMYKEILTFSGWDVVGGLTMVTQGQGINILLNIYFGPVVNAARAIAYQVQGAFHQFTSNFMTAVNPELIKSYARKEFRDMIQLVNDSALYSYYLLLLFVLPLMFKLSFLLNLWLGKYPENTVEFTELVLALMMIRSLARPVIFATHATGDIKSLNLYAGILGLFPLPVSWMFLYYGASAITTFWILLIWGILANTAEIIILKTKMKEYFSVVEHMKNVYLRSLLVTALLFPLIYITSISFSDTIISFSIYYIISLLFGVVILFYVGMPARMKKNIYNLIKNKYALYRTK